MVKATAGCLLCSTKKDKDAGNLPALTKMAHCPCSGFRTDRYWGKNISHEHGIVTVVADQMLFSMFGRALAVKKNTKRCHHSQISGTRYPSRWSST
ncbi:hypothetical protein HGB07_07375 [Candidatus Roizmanbacteria bacterium]|nr:hypothetical protein [Candidatus Roizmanbacteria bacterium]